MTPKQKSEQIIKTFKNKGYSDPSEINILSLILIDEVIGQWEYIDTYLSDFRGVFNPNLKFWYSVREFFIEKM